MTGRILYLLIYDTRERFENLKIKIVAPVMTINPICESHRRSARDFSSTEPLKQTPASRPRNVRSHHPPLAASHPSSRTPDEFSPPFVRQAIASRFSYN
jgi:hypothetical protein